MKIYIVLLAIEYIMAIVVFIALFKYVVPYGRYVRINSKQKYLISRRAGWLIMEIPAILTIAIVYLVSVKITDDPTHMPHIVCFVLWQIHYVYRTFIFPFLTPNKANRFPLIVVFSGAVFNILNGFINGWALFFSESIWGKSSFSSPIFYAGIGIFLAGFVIHIISDKVLRDVKREHNGGYGIPHAFLHRKVIAPNYFGELLQWTGFFITTLSPAALAFVLFTGANLVPRAYSHRIWYGKMFPNYTHTRKMIIPYVL